MQKYIDSVKQADLMAKYLKGILTAEERNVLNQWLEENPEHRALFAGLKEKEVVSEKMKLYHRYSPDRSWQVISRTIRSGRKTLYLRYLQIIAVAAVVIIGFGMFYLLKNTQHSVPELVPSSIIAGEAKAWLHLNDGSMVDLDTLKSFVMGGVKVAKLADGQIKYIKNTDGTDTNRLPVYNQIEVPRGGEYDMVLEDGTQVWLNSETNLKFPVAFTGEERKVFLEGEAYFVVAKNAQKPFRVVIDGQILEVLGTEFNVNAYREEERVYTTLVEGKVKVTTVNQEEVFLQPGEQVALEVKSGLYNRRFVSVEDVTGWRKGLFVLEDQTLEQIMQKLSRWYDFDLFYQNESLKKVIFKGSVPRYGDFVDILNLLQKTGEVRFRVQGRTVVVY